MALGMLNKDKAKNDNVDEDDAVRQHEKFYGNEGSGGQASSNNVGAAAAMQAMKMFNGGGSEQAKGGQNQFIGMAMGQAAQLFDKQQAQGKTVSTRLRRLNGYILTERRIPVRRSRMLLRKLRRWRSSSTSRVRRVATLAVAEALVVLGAC
jgi:hypothetical protein